MMSEPLTLYGPHIAGAGGCVTLEIFSNHRASHTTYVEGPSGELVECDLWTAEGAMRMAANIQQQEAVLGGRMSRSTGHERIHDRHDTCFPRFHQGPKRSM